MDPIYRGEDIRLPVTVTAPADDAAHDYSGATFEIVTTAVAPDETHTFAIDVDTRAAGSVTAHCDLTDTETAAMTSRVHGLAVWCTEGENTYVCAIDILPVI